MKIKQCLGWNNFYPTQGRILLPNGNCHKTSVSFFFFTCRCECLFRVISSLYKKQDHVTKFLSPSFCNFFAGAFYFMNKIFNNKISVKVHIFLYTEWVISQEKKLRPKNGDKVNKICLNRAPHFELVKKAIPSYCSVHTVYIK